MKNILIIVLFFSLKAQSQKDTKKSLYEYEGIICTVAHFTEDGVFGCDFKGALYPSQIWDSTIRKWFIKKVNGDSLFYYRTDVERLYIWNAYYGYYFYKVGGGGYGLSNKYNGSDTIRRIEQIWRPRINSKT